MNILLVNDDGYEAQGIQALYKSLQKIAHVTVVAPDRQNSGVGHHVNVNKKIELQKVKENWYAFHSTPADCVKIALSGLIKDIPPIDLVVSGMNHGANLGLDVYYSGTVAAAREAMFFSIPSVAVSLAYLQNDQNFYFQEQSEYIVHLIEKLKKKNFLKSGVLYNINSPNKSVNSHLKVIGLSNASPYLLEAVQEEDDYYSISVKNINHTPKIKQESDIFFSQQGYTTLTPIVFDCTCHHSLKEIDEQMNDIL